MRALILLFLLLFNNNISAKIINTYNNIKDKIYLLSENGTLRIIDINNKMVNLLDNIQACSLVDEMLFIIDNNGILQISDFNQQREHVIKIANMQELIAQQLEASTNIKYKIKHMFGIKANNSLTLLFLELALNYDNNNNYYFLVLPLEFNKLKQKPILLKSSVGTNQGAVVKVDDNTVGILGTGVKETQEILYFLRYNLWQNKLDLILVNTASKIKALIPCSLLVDNNFADGVIAHNSNGDFLFYKLSDFNMKILGKHIGDVFSLELGSTNKDMINIFCLDAKTGDIYQINEDNKKILFSNSKLGYLTLRQGLLFNLPASGVPIVYNLATKQQIELDFKQEFKIDCSDAGLSASFEARLFWVPSKRHHLAVIVTDRDIIGYSTKLATDLMVIRILDNILIN